MALHEQEVPDLHDACLRLSFSDQAKTLQCTKFKVNSKDGIQCSDPDDHCLDSRGRQRRPGRRVGLEVVDSSTIESEPAAAATRKLCGLDQPGESESGRHGAGPHDFQDAPGPHAHVRRTRLLRGRDRRGPPEHRGCQDARQDIALGPGCQLILEVEKVESGISRLQAETKGLPRQGGL